MAPRSTTNGTRRTSTRPAKSGTKVVSIAQPMLTSAQNDIEVEVPEEPGSVLRLYSKVKPEDNPFTERELVFSVDGTDYTAPVEVPASWGLHYIRARIAYNIDFAVVWALEMALTPAGVDALTSVPNLTARELDGITKRITQKFIDSTSLPKGQSKNE